MKVYDDWEALTDAIQEQCREILETDVAPIAREIFREHINRDIYGVYQPEVYQRRNRLADKVYSQYYSDDHTLFITSGERANKSVVKGYKFEHRYPGSFLELIEEGPYGIWTSGFKRPAVSNAQKDIDNSSRINTLIQRRLDNL